ncbi:MAG: hypothetical protein QM681_10500 [Novosphingobium sp.]
MIKTHEIEDEPIDLGAVTDETHGDGGDIVPDLPQARSQTGILVD